MRRGAFTLGVPLLWMIGGVAVLAMAGLSLAGMSAVRPDRTLHDTYYIVVHGERAIEAAAVFPVFASWYYFFPRITGWIYSARLGRIHFWLTFVGIVAMDVPQVVALVYPGAVLNAADAFHYALLASSVGVYLAAAGTIVFAVNMALAVWRRQPVL
jgi:cytochrome c oxidase subunit 1